MNAQDTLKRLKRLVNTPHPSTLEIKWLRGVAFDYGVRDDDHWTMANRLIPHFIPLAVAERLKQ